MKILSPVCMLPLLLQSVFAQSSAAPQACDANETAQERCIAIEGKAVRRCSTEIVNTVDCMVIVDRRYPVTLPAIQMHHGKFIWVVLNNPLPFETVSLDWTSAAAQPGTEQLASMLTAAIPDLKGLTGSPAISLAALAGAPQGIGAAARVPGAVVVNPNAALLAAIDSEFSAMATILQEAQDALPPNDKPQIYPHILAVYAQLNQAIAPLPKPGSGPPPNPGPEGPQTFVPPKQAPQTPNPWADYGHWRAVLLCELAGGSVDGIDCKVGAGPTDPAFLNVLGDIAALQARLPSTPPATAPTNPLFDQSTFDGLAKQIQGQILKLVVRPGPDAPNDTADIQSRKDRLVAMQAAENSLLARLSALSATLTSVQKDFTTYYQSIYLAPDNLPDLKELQDKNQHKILNYILMSPVISDPRDRGPQENQPLLYPRFLGRPVTYTVNVVDNIANARASVYASSTKVAIATVSAVYANPRLESSAGALYSFVHTRSFVNQTITNPTGTSYTAGEIVIQQTKTQGQLVPFVAAHYRLGDEFPSMQGRRGAFYATGFVGLNPVTTLPEFGGGPTLSWRSIMLSILYNRAHQTQLISGETVGEVVCNPAAPTGATPPPCTPAPPAPVTQVKGLNAFAIGLSVRIPTSFAPLTGGVSR
jgi:hypothetical protein